MKTINESVQNYYGKELKSTEDLKTNACCTLEAPPENIQKALKNVHDEVQAKYYGCGLTIPTVLEGLRILDLGSGSGRDCYIAAQLVGQTGQVVGVDMTKEQLAVACEYLDYHKEKFGYENSNVTFLEGNIERLNELNLEKNSFDIIISNCVINLAQDKEKVLKDAYDLLKEGGEMYFSDVYSNKRISKELQEDEVLWGECLSGALYINDFETIAKSVGFSDPRLVESKPVTVNNCGLQKKLGNIKFSSLTYRLFKIKEVEKSLEDYGVALKYTGGIEEMPQEFLFDSSFTFIKDDIYKVDGNTFRILKSSRYNKYFEFFGDLNNHLGPYEVKKELNLFESNSSKTSCC